MVQLKFSKKVHEIGGSLMLVLPKDWCKFSQIKAGDTISISLHEGGGLTINDKSN